MPQYISTEVPSYFYQSDAVFCHWETKVLPQRHDLSESQRSMCVVWCTVTCGCNYSSVPDTGLYDLSFIRREATEGLAWECEYSPA